MNQRSRIVVGKNSRIVREISPLLSPHTAISHTEIGATDFSHVDDVFVFSWDHASLKSSLDMLSRIPGEKTVFVSTVAVWSLQVRAQWNLYPNAKAAAEDFVLGRGGRVIRVGITEDRLLEKLRGTVPYTSAAQLAELIDAWDGTQPSVVDAIVLRKGGLAGSGRVIAAIFEWLSRRLPSAVVFQAPLQAVAKALGVRHTGYTADVLRCCSDELLIGYGALGSVYDRAHPDHNRRILVSGRPNMALETDGFVHTMVGFAEIGLSALWHGVGTRRVEGRADKVIKSVPLVVNRPRPSSARTTVAHVQSIHFHDRTQFWTVYALDIDGCRRALHANTIVLAAGPLENTRLLMTPDLLVAEFSDHEIAMIGSCSSRSAERAEGIRKVGPFIVRQFSHLREGPSRPFVLEFRPYVASKHRGAPMRDAGFYLTSTGGVLRRLMNDPSLARINEAVFNKFGIAIDTGACSLFVQALCRGCVQAKRVGSDQIALTRTRLSQRDWADIKDHARTLILDFQPQEHVVSVDAQHIMGGSEVLEDAHISALLRHGRLLIVGSPTMRELSAVHHTPDLQRVVANTQPMSPDAEIREAIPQTLPMGNGDRGTGSGDDFPSS